MRRPTPFATSYMVGREDKRTNNRTKLPTLKHNAAAGYQCPVKIELLKGAGLLWATYTVCNVLYGRSRGQKNEQQNKAPSPKTQCSCRLSVSSENRAFERCRSTVGDLHRLQRLIWSVERTKERTTEQSSQP